MELLGERINRLRTERKLSQAEVARRLGLSRAWIVGEWECGYHVPASRNLAGLAKVFGVTLEYLQHGREDPWRAAITQAILSSPNPDPRLLAMVKNP